MQEQEFWQGMTLSILEELRMRLRTLVPFIDKKERTIVYTHFKDEILGVRKDDSFEMPKMTSLQYEKRSWITWVPIWITW
ncbi:MAG: hypothetical protein R3E89_00325 [Thiolinea sp.]